MVEHHHHPHHITSTTPPPLPPRRPCPQTIQPPQIPRPTPRPSVKAKISTPNSASEAWRSENAEELTFVIKRLKVTAGLGMYERAHAKMQRFDALSEDRIGVEPARLVTSFLGKSKP